MDNTQAMKTTTRTAVVTGAARGIGLATTAALLAAGHRVALVDRNREDLDAAIASFGTDRAFAIEADLGDPLAASMIKQAVERQFGVTSILVNNAGIAPKHDGKGWNIVQITLEEWHQVLAVNLTAMMLMCQQFIPDMQRQRFGRIVNISSSAGRTSGVNNGPAYMATKAGVLGLTRHIAGSFGPDGITANAVAPGRIVTPLSSQWSPEKEAAYNLSNPTRRSGTPEEAAAAIVYLTQDAAAFTNGAVIDVNGGAFMS